MGIFNKFFCRDSKMKVLFVCKERISYGVSIGLINSAKLTADGLNNLLCFHDLEAKVVTCIDGNFIDKELHQFKPKVCIIEAIWVSPEKLEELSQLHPKVIFVVMIHSMFPFLATEGIAIDYINRYLQIDSDKIFIGGNNKAFVKDFIDLFQNECMYLPNIYYIKAENHPGHEHNHRHEDTINISCFGATRPLKNQFNQAIAAIFFAEEIDKKLKFHINGNRVEQDGDNVKKNLISLFDSIEYRDKGYELIMHPWTGHKEFLQLIKNNIDIGMQVSFSETFNGVVADHIYTDVPIIGSKEIHWINDRYRVNASDIDDISFKLHQVYGGKQECILRNKAALYNYNESAVDAWKFFFKLEKSL